MLMMSMPSLFGPVASVLAAVAALVSGLTLARKSHVQPPYDVEQRIADLTMKVRSPWKYRVSRVGRWMDGE